MGKNGRSNHKNKKNFLLEITILCIFAFSLSFLLNASLERLVAGVSPWLAVPLLLLVIVLGVLADGMGVATARASERALLSMASRKVKGAREAVWFVRNASKVSSVLNDVTGDVAAALSGALAVVVVYRLRSALGWEMGPLATAAGVGLASMLGVGGKALFKPFALRNSEQLLLILGRARSLYLKVVGKE